MAVDFKNELTKKIADFLNEIGIETIPAQLENETFLPGILVENGKILFDEEKLKYPGDLLHEAGHLAVAPSNLRSGLSDQVNLPDVSMDAIESYSIAWSFAASVHLGIDPRIVFHKDGYKGQSESLLLNFSVGVYIGANGLQDFGMTYTGEKALGMPAFPQMIKWLRD